MEYPNPVIKILQMVQKATYCGKEYHYKNYKSDFFYIAVI